MVNKSKHDVYDTYVHVQEAVQYQKVSMMMEGVSA
jgi:hypothetical protein